MGTARLAVDELNGWTGSSDRAAVVGCGAVGLATARLLQRRGTAVTIYAKDIPPNTTSNIAGAQWVPFSVFERGKTTAAFDEQFARAARLSWRLFQDLIGSIYGIRWIENYSVGDTPAEGPLDSPFYVNGVDLGPREHPFPARYVRRFTTMLIEPPVYMAAMLRDFLLAGGRLVVRELASRDEISALDEPIVFNCTGLGARTLVGDAELTPVKGQLTFLLPQPEVDYITLLDGPLYMFPRADGILLGGTFERGNWDVAPEPESSSASLTAIGDFSSGCDSWPVEAKGTLLDEAARCQSNRAQDIEDDPSRQMSVIQMSPVGVRQRHDGYVISRVRTVRWVVASEGAMNVDCPWVSVRQLLVL